MTKKKRGQPDVEELLARPWCYYCERDFDDLKILISHQKAKHFKCERCNRRLNTAGGLSVHMSQVHKETLEAVDNALPNRSGLSLEIFGMEGIPDEIVQQHRQRILSQFHGDQAGNAQGGAAGGSGAKKPKIEGAGDLKARLAAFKAKKAAAAAGVSSGDGTPTGAGQGSPDPGTPQSPGQQQPGLSGYPQTQYPLPGNPSLTAYPQPFAPQFAPQGYAMPPQQAPYLPSTSPFNQGPPGFAPPPGQGPPGMNQLPGYPQPPPYVSSPPPGMYQPTHQQGSPMSSNGSFPGASGLPNPPGLPQRPAFGAPPVNSTHMQQMHQGRYAGQGSAQNMASQDPRARQQESQQQPQPVATEADVDDLIANAAKESQSAKETQAVQPGENQTTEPSTEKKSKKDKDKVIRMVYDDDEISPEEKMAELPRYAFDPSKEKPETVLGDPITATVVGPVVGEDDVLDTQGD